MKKLFLVAGFLLHGFSLLAFNVTFRVDMNGISGFTTPELNGTFNNWCGNCAPMTDANNDRIWETTINLNSGNYQYKFSADNWSSQETLIAGSPCTITSNGFTNRTLNVSGNVVLPLVCWGSCGVCTYFPVTFQVNLNGILGYAAPNVSGSFNNWCGNCNLMTDANGDGIWTTTINLFPGNHEYKFSYDNWAGSESLTPGSPCTITTSGFTNRFLNLTQAITLPPVCWQTCNTATGTPVIPTISIAQTAGSNPTCKESEVVFTATVSNAPATPFYQWKVNGAFAGSNSSTFKTNSLSDGQVVTCEVTCNCNQTLPSVSNSIAMGVISLVTPSVSVSRTTTGSLCGGDTVSFLATPLFGGSNPIYQWKINGSNAGTNSSNFTINGLTSNANVTCLMTSNAPCQSKPWTLIWADEFSGSSLDLTKWKPEIGAGGWGNNELQFYTNSPNNIQLNNGQLRIIARNTGSGNQQYTSARLITKGLFSTKYGKIMGRMKFPNGQGLWPAFWMLGANIDQVNWPGCGETDIMEHVNAEPKIHGTCHWNNNGRVYLGNSINLDVNIFHEYSVEWDSLSIRFFVDGTQYHQHFISASNGSLDEFTKPFFILLNLAVGGQWPGPPNAGTQFPAIFDVDYVRVFKHETLPIGQVSSNTIGLSLIGLNPETPGPISGDTAVCANQTGLLFSIPSIPNEVYTWTLPDSATIQSGQGTPFITANWGPGPGTIQVKASNVCGISSARKFLVGIKSCNTTNGKPGSSGFYLFPNPGNGIYQIKADNLKGNIKIQVFNGVGKMVFIKKGIPASSTFLLNIEKEPAGKYFVKIESGERTDTFKIIKN